MESIKGNIALKNIDKSEWRTYRFDEIAKSISERVDPNNTDLEVYVGLEHLDAESIHIKRKGTPADVNGQKLRCYPGDVIFGKRRAYQRKAAIVDFHGICSAHAMVLRANPAVIIPDLFPFFLHSDLFMHRAIDISVGSLSPTINWKTLRKQEFLLPPKEQQAQLAELLWAMDEVLEREKSTLAKTATLREINREKLFSLGINALNDPNKVTLKKGKSGLINDAWDEYKFFEAIEITSGQVDPKEEEYCNLFQIGSERIEPNTGKITEFKTAKESNIISGNYLFTEDHIIFSKIRPYFKKVANPGFTGLCSADIYPLKPISSELNKEFLFYFLLTEKFTQKLLRFQNRTGMPKVNREELGSMYIPIPTLTEQKEIVEILKTIDSTLDSINSKLISSKTLQKSLINQIF